MELHLATFEAAGNLSRKSFRGTTQPARHRGAAEQRDEAKPGAPNRCPQAAAILTARLSSNRSGLTVVAGMLNERV
jgi:hypothetical protein